jgi:hypothetical protein
MHSLSAPSADTTLAAAVFLPPLQAYSAALAALVHCPCNAKAWLRVAEACKAAGRWQLAQLYYSIALDEMGVTDEAARVSRQQAGGSGCIVCW